MTHWSTLPLYNWSFTRHWQLLCLPTTEVDSLLLLKSLSGLNYICLRLSTETAVIFVTVCVACTRPEQCPCPRKRHLTWPNLKHNGSFYCRGLHYTVVCGQVGRPGVATSEISFMSSWLISSCNWLRMSRNWWTVEIEETVAGSTLKLCWFLSVF